MKALRSEVQKEDKDVKTASVHTSQKDAAKGFGGKYGVMKERQDKVRGVAMGVAYWSLPTL